jgi:hypothetical protein
MTNTKIITEFEDLLPETGTCYASKKITEEGCLVGFMYRETPVDDIDTGWRYYSGTEDQAYVDNIENLMLYDVNVIANYDRAIIPMVKKPFGSEWERIEGTSKFRPIEN